MALVKFKHSVVFPSGNISFIHGQIVDIEEKDLLSELVNQGVVDKIEEIDHKKLTKAMLGRE